MRNGGRSRHRRAGKIKSERGSEEICKRQKKSLRDEVLGSAEGVDGVEAAREDRLVGRGLAPAVFFIGNFFGGSKPPPYKYDYSSVIFADAVAHMPPSLTREG